MSNPAERAAEHAREAEEALGKKSVAGIHLNRAAVHATLALYYQREAEKQQQ